jgi:flagellar export protein FliJ
MAFKTRLDALVRIRERAEESAQRDLGRARQLTVAAETALAQARSRALAETRVAGTAAGWQNAESARIRELGDLKRWERTVLEARAKEAEARSALEKAHRQHEVIRRAAQNKREEMAHQADRAERKLLDELATMQFGRKQ